MITTIDRDDDSHDVGMDDNNDSTTICISDDMKAVQLAGNPDHASIRNSNRQLNDLLQASVAIASKTRFPIAGDEPGCW
jgi:hypothetical protein